jgi:tetratricopeptide (TPR) repeat protein
MKQQLEELYLEAETDIRNNNFAEALRKYQSILYDEPASAPVHNSLGWLYKTQFDNYSKAESHYLAAMKCDPKYPHAWHNYAVLLTDMERYDELKKHLERCLDVMTIDKSWVYIRFGLMEELNLRFQDAIQYYEKAILVSLNDEKIKDYRNDIERCNSKQELPKNHTGWFGKIKL